MRSSSIPAATLAVLCFACFNDRPIDSALQPDPAGAPAGTAAGSGGVPAAVGGSGVEAAGAGGSGVARKPSVAGQGGSVGAAGSATAGVGGAAGAGAASVAGTGAAAPMAGSAAAPVRPSGFSVDSATGELVFRTEPLVLETFKEAYTCFAATLEEDVVVDGFVKSSQPFLHHTQFVMSFLPEPDGISECKEQFKLTWLPIFLAGAGPSEMRFDEGVGHVLPAGTQLVLQMHLLNTKEQTVREQVEIRMSLSKAANPTPVSPWAIGSADIQLAAKQAGKAQKVCTQTGPVKVLAVFPHMHTLGTKMTIEVGKSLDAMRPLYTRDPFNFDDQRMEKMTLELDTGDLLRVTCDYMNTTDFQVGFGESTNDEMCFFVGFALGESPAGADCPDLWEHLLTL